MNRFFLLSCIIGFLCLLVSTGSVFGQDDSSNPTVDFNISFQQETIKINEPIMATIWLANKGEIPIQNTRILFSKPDFILIHQETCDSDPFATPIEFGILTAHSTLPEPTVICFTLDSSRAISGEFNILTSVMYDWEKGKEIINVEKKITSDLIGVNSILGVPLSFAGFILPGLMVLTVLRIFQIKKVGDLESSDRILLGVILSIFMLGPFAWFATRPNSPAWVSWLDFSQQVSIERLIVYTSAGLVIGLIMGGFYKGYEYWKKWKKLVREKALQINAEDTPPELLIKAISINKTLQKNRIFITHKENHTKIYGYHTVIQNNSLYIFPQFNLLLNKLTPQMKKNISPIIKSIHQSKLTQEQMLKILLSLEKNYSEVFDILNYVLVESSPGKFVTVKGWFHKVDAEDYDSPLIGKEDGFLLKFEGDI